MKRKLSLFHMFFITAYFPSLQSILRFSDDYFKEEMFSR